VEGSDAGDAGDAVGAVMFIHWTSMLLWELISGKRNRNRNKHAAKSDVADVSDAPNASCMPPPGVVKTPESPLHREALPLTPKSALISTDVTDRLTVAFQSSPKTPLVNRRHSRRQRRRDDPSRVFDRKRFKYPSSHYFF